MMSDSEPSANVTPHARPALVRDDVGSDWLLAKVSDRGFQDRVG
jgi:hypothetical protein